MSLSSPAPAATTFRLVLYDALASEAMGTLTTGVFLTGFLVSLHASNLAIGLLAAVPFAVQFLQLPAVILVERLRTRRAICTWSAAIGRTFLIAAAMAPFLPKEYGIILLVASIACNQALAAIAGCSWNSWMRDLVPEAEFGRFFGRRAAATTALATALALGCGLLIDRWKTLLPAQYPISVYTFLFLFSAAIGFLGVWLLSITPDQRMPPPTERTRAHILLTKPFRDSNFRRLMGFLASWNFAANLASPFFAVYMLRTLGYSMTTVILLTTASQFSNLIALSVWGGLIDRFSNKAVLGIAAPLFLLCTLGWTLTGLTWMKPWVFWFLLVIHVLMGVATAGVALASGNIAMKLSPAGQATAYLAANSVVSATCASAAPIIGGLCADFFARHDLSLAFTWKGGGTVLTVPLLDLHALTFLFGIAAVVELYSLHRLALVEETSGTTDRLLLRHLLLEARRSVHSLSSAAGLLRVVKAPSWRVRPRSEAPPAADFS